MDHTDCIFFKKPCYCRALIAGVCTSAQCGFHKTAEERATSIALAYERMRSRSYDDQVYFAQKYYHGLMPWMEGGARA